jgi:uncharacterized protein (TIGR02646 family)
VISLSLRARVRQRAGGRCEYCRLHEDDSTLAMHVEHVTPRKHGGRTAFDNLALACGQCNLHRGTDLVSIDPSTGQRTELFDPRKDDWETHFMFVDDMIEGLTPKGRATVALLRMNDPDRRSLRASLSDQSE